MKRNRKVENIREADSGIKADENGLYLGKFTDTKDYHKFKKDFIMEFLRCDVSLTQLVKDINEREGTNVNYYTARHWLLNNGIKINSSGRTPNVFRSVRFDKKVAQTFEQYQQVIPFKVMCENGLRLLFGYEGNDIVVIYYPEGTVLFYWQKNRTIAVCTADFKDSQLKTIQGIADLAYKNGQDWLINFAQSAGLPVFPPYTTEQQQ